MRRWIFIFWASLLLLASCKTTPALSEEEQAYLDRTKGFVAPGSYPVANEVAGSDGYLLKFNAGEHWNSKDSPHLRVKSLDGKWMPFYAGDSGKALMYCPEHFSLLHDQGQALQIYLIASPEDSISEIVLDNHTIQVALFQRGDSIVPLTNEVKVGSPNIPKGEFKADSLNSKDLGPKLQSR